MRTSANLAAASESVGHALAVVQQRKVANAVHCLICHANIVNRALHLSHKHFLVREQAVKALVELGPKHAAAELASVVILAAKTRAHTLGCARETHDLS